MYNSLMRDHEKHDKNDRTMTMRLVPVESTHCTEPNGKRFEFRLAGGLSVFLVFVEH